MEKTIVALGRYGACSRLPGIDNSEASSAEEDDYVNVSPSLECLELASFG